jgi:hypothetical protein
MRFRRVPAAAVALFEGLRVTLEDVEYLFDKGVVIPDKDVTIPHITADGDAFVFRGSRLLVGRHVGF